MRHSVPAIVLMLVAASTWAAEQPVPVLEPVAEPVAVPAPTADATAESSTSAPGVSLQDIQTFTAVFRAIKNAYVDPVEDRKLMQDAVRGLLAGLDPHSEYLDRSMLVSLDEDTRGAYAGLGVEVLFVDGLLRVVTPIDDTPASRAGIKPGDVITRIDGEPVPSHDAQHAVEKLRGKPGSAIALTIAREGSPATLEMTLKREVIKVASVRMRNLEPGYAYLRIAQFQQHTGRELRDKLRRLAKGGGLRGLILDLRSNPGGLLDAAIEVSDAFLDSGVIVSTRGREGGATDEFSATRGDLVNGAPVVVLVDSGTASAAEIVAGALKDRHRAVVMGQRTFGKGSVQSVLPLDGGDALKLTTARYFTPSGQSIQAFGIEPDIELADLRLTVPDRPASLITSERNLPGHLVGEFEGQQLRLIERDAALDDDFALNEALNVLKGLALARERQSRSEPKRG